MYDILITLYFTSGNTKSNRRKIRYFSCCGDWKRKDACFWNTIVTSHDRRQSKRSS